MANSNYLTEIKKEYTIQLVNILTPSIFEGVNSIYSEVKSIAKDGEELKIFQGFLTKIPTWTEQIINTEATRIKSVTPNSELIDDLIKAVIQSNILLLTSTDISEKHKMLKEFNLNLNYNKFIHNIYIEVAKTFYNYPHLFFHKLPALEIKKNQMKSHKLIKEAIEEAIRKMLPLQLILKKYLGIMSEINDEKYLKSLVNSENKSQQFQLVNKTENVSDTNTQKGGNNNIIQSNPPMSLKEIYEQHKKAGGNSSSVKYLPLSETNNPYQKNNNVVKSERKININIPSNIAKPHYSKHNDSETSQPYANQEGGIEEEFSNMGTSNKKGSLSTVSENSETGTESNKKTIFNFRGY